MEIRKFTSRDIQPIVELWYHASVIAHPFISPAIWESHRQEMAEKYLPQSETYVALRDQEIVGFISMVDNYMAALFVKTELQGQGIGTMLLDFIKKKQHPIELRVFQKNRKSVGYYKHSGFSIITGELEENTNEPEYLMRWEP